MRRLAMTPDRMVSAACSLIESRKKGGVRLFVAIDGGTGAGKSTLAKEIRNRRGGVSIIRTDHFFRPLHEYPASRLADLRRYEDLYNLYFPWERMRDEALTPIRRGETATYQRYDWTADRLLNWITVEPEEIVLVEGVYANRPELRPMLDAAIFVDAPRDERRSRVLARGPNPFGDWMTPWMAAEDWYFEHIRPQDASDLILRSAE
jgi:uridine kinase